MSGPYFEPQYAVAHVKDGEITHLVAGPFVSFEYAEATAFSWRLTDGPSYQVAKSEHCGWWTV